ncbi:MAG: polyribonucleotide nucleotidyltransferase [Proteobacteria bacterium]|nr:polyribonucleotide nucleotidyltransferase [Pseudomonadota bacterium]
MSLTKEIQVGDHTWKFEFQKYAKQANGSVMVQSGETQVLVTACASYEAKPHQNFFPLGVDYTEKFYAAGRIPGGYRKREGRPADHETLIARVIDRQLRPCFPAGFLHDTVIQCTVLSYEKNHNPIPLAMVGAATALMISDIPFHGPVASLLVGYSDDQFILNPGQTDKSDLDLTIAAKPGGLLMVEAAANFLSEEKMIEAISYGVSQMSDLWQMQQDLVNNIGKEKMSFEAKKTDQTLMDLVREYGTNSIKDALSTKEKQARTRKLSVAQHSVYEQVLVTLTDKLQNQSDTHQYDPTAATTQSALSQCIEELKHELLKDLILVQKQRIDGRHMDEVRPLQSEVNVLKRTHGSALFTRGETQALASVTLGSLNDRLRYETLHSKDSDDTFMLHYNFPSYCVGEANMPRSTSRREIGHGALAKKAFAHAMPDFEDFGYVIRLVSEVLESNGSSSMATVCATTLAFLNAGIDIKESIAGIAMGLVKGDDDHVILTDILGDEDHLGDMDFKVCGGSSGVTALQMDIKIPGITEDILKEALTKALVARQHILTHMATTISSPGKVSPYAPQIFKVKIPADKVRDIIGPGGKTIKKIIADTGVQIDIEDNGVVSIVAHDSTSAEAAKSMIRHITAEPKAGEIYLGRVTKIVDFGCFVEIKPGLEGLVHISQIEPRRIESVGEVVSEGEEIIVKVIDIDRQGRLKLSRKDAIGQSPTHQTGASSPKK